MTSSNRPLDGALLIIRLNWPFYLIAGIVIVGWPLLSSSPRTVTLSLGGWIVWMATLWWTAASIVASYWVYDRSKLRGIAWVEEMLPQAPRSWLNIHAGFDQNTARLQARFPASHGISIDIFDAGRMTEPAIRRARRRYAADAVPARHSALPAADGSVDAVFLLFAAHELRTRSSRDELFREIERVLIREGRLVLAEHVRDVANAAAYGPGAWHFLPHAEWVRLTERFVVAAEIRMTPFVHVWSFSKYVPYRVCWHLQPVRLTCLV